MGSNLNNDMEVFESTFILFIVIRTAIFLFSPFLWCWRAVDSSHLSEMFLFEEEQNQQFNRDCQDIMNFVVGLIIIIQLLIWMVVYAVRV
jgi:hypothetical protein